MNIIEQYIEINNDVLSKLTRENPDLGAGIIDTLAVLSNYIKDNDVQFTEEQKNKMLQKVEEVDIEALKKKEEEIKVAEVQVGEIEKAQAISLQDNKNCTYFWVRVGLGNRHNGYFVLAVTSGSNAIMFGTYLANGVFTKTPTRLNKLVRERIEQSRLVESSIGVFTLYLSDGTITKELNAPKSVMSDLNVAQTYLNATIRDFTPIVIVDDSRGDVTRILSINENTIGVDSAKINWVVNTMMMVAWAEGIQLVESDKDFAEIGKSIKEAVYYSKRFDGRLYVILTADTDTDDSLLVFKYGSDDAQNYIQQSLDARGEISSFVVGILVDGVFQDGIDPYMFQKSTSQTKVTQPVFTPEQIARMNAVTASQKTTEKVFVVKLKNGDFSYEVGEDNLFNLEDSGELSDVIAVFENGFEGNTIRPKRVAVTQQHSEPKENVSDVFVEQTDELTDEDLKGLDDLDVDTLGHIELDDLEDINFDEE
jgi:hypothetical protein